MTAVSDIAEFLDKYLEVRNFRDATFNGLQIEGDKIVKRIGFSVNCSAGIFRKAADEGCQLIIVHHGLIWGGLSRISGYMKDRLKILLENNIGLYACHLPLDAHPETGNNVCLLELFGGEKTGSFAEYGFSGRLKQPISWDTFIEIIRKQINPNPRILRNNPGMVENVAVLSGEMSLAGLEEAERKGIKVILCGEGKGESLFQYPAEEMGISLVFAGHTETEWFGIRKLRKVVSDQFGNLLETMELED